MEATVEKDMFYVYLFCMSSFADPRPDRYRIPSYSMLTEHQQLLCEVVPEYADMCKSDHFRAMDMFHPRNQATLIDYIRYQT